MVRFLTPRRTGSQRSPVGNPIRRGPIYVSTTGPPARSATGPGGVPADRVVQVPFAFEQGDGVLIAVLDAEGVHLRLESAPDRSPRPPPARDLVGQRSSRRSAPYSCSSRYWRPPAAAARRRRRSDRASPAARVEDLDGPSCESCSRPFSNCLRLRASFARTRAKISGENLGSSAYSNAVPSQRCPDPQRAGVEQTDHVAGPGFLDHLPFRAEELVGHGEPQRLLLARKARIHAPVEPAASRPARRRAGRGGRDPCSPGSEDESGELRLGRDTALSVDAQAGTRRRASRTKASRNSSTPTSVIADPKNAGDSSPRNTFWWSNGSPAASRSSISSRTLAGPRRPPRGAASRGRRAAPRP